MGTSARYQRAHGEDLPSNSGASKLGRAAYASQRFGKREVVNKPYAKAAGFEVLKEERGSRRGTNGRIRGMAY